MTGAIAQAVLLAAAFTATCFSADPGILACYTFDRATCNVVADSSGKGHDGKLHGAAWIATDQRRPGVSGGRQLYRSWA